ncbi:MAG: hypothetical protein KGM15_11955 [Pseudomonadota bacterium]|nr:hypothetical protein [Pseudomonadota bacterium]
MIKQEFPAPVIINGRLFFEWLAVENHKRALLGLLELPRDPNAPVRLIPAKVVASEFGFGRRTLGRRTLGRRIAKPKHNVSGEAA